MGLSEGLGGLSERLDGLSEGLGGLSVGLGPRQRGLPRRAGWVAPGPQPGGVPPTPAEPGWVALPQGPLRRLRLVGGQPVRALTPRTSGEAEPWEASAPPAPGCSCAR